MSLKDLSIPKYAFHLPWFIFDIDNVQLITTGSDIIPSDIKDTKEIVLTEVPIPGLNFSPILPGGAGNRKISFTIPLIKRNNTVGNVLILKQFDNLRQNAVGLTSFFSEQFETTPQVLYSWGTGSVPLVYWVKKCDASHKQGWVNAMGFPQYSEIEIELWLDETNILYKAEEVFRKLSSLAGMVYGAYGIVRSTKGERVY